MAKSDGTNAKNRLTDWYRGKSAASRRNPSRA